MVPMAIIFSQMFVAKWYANVCLVYYYILTYLYIIILHINTLPCFLPAENNKYVYFRLEQINAKHIWFSMLSHKILMTPLKIKYPHDNKHYVGVGINAARVSLT